jgi:hypothetical protein
MSIKGDKMKFRTLNQFKVTSRLLGLFDAVNERFDDSDVVLDYLLFYRFIDTASGVWLDIIGDIVGVERPFKDRLDIFTFKHVGGVDDSSLSYSNTTTGGGGHYTSLNGSPTTEKLGDEDFRLLINAKISATNSAPTIPAIYTFIKDAFDVESIVTSPAPGEVAIEILEPLSNFERRLVLTFAPVAAGVNVGISNWV